MTGNLPGGRRGQQQRHERDQGPRATRAPLGSGGRSAGDGQTRHFPALWGAMRRRARSNPALHPGQVRSSMAGLRTWTRRQRTRPARPATKSFQPEQGAEEQGETSRYW